MSMGWCRSDHCESPPEPGEIQDVTIVLVHKCVDAMRNSTSRSPVLHEMCRSSNPLIETVYVSRPASKLKSRQSWASGNNRAARQFPQNAGIAIGDTAIEITGLELSNGAADLYGFAVYIQPSHLSSLL